MFKKDSQKIKEIKLKVMNSSRNALALISDIECIEEILIDYCDYNANSMTINIIQLVEILKDKNKKLRDLIDTENIEIVNL